MITFNLYNFHKTTSKNSKKENFASRISFGATIGQHFNNIGTIIDKPNILNLNTKKMIPCDVICSSTQNGGTIHLVKSNDDLLKKVQNLFNNSPQILKDIVERCGCVLNPFIEKSLQGNKDLAKILKDSMIAEISYMKLNSERDIKKVSELGYKKNDNNKDVIFLQNFVVTQPEYKNASRHVAIPLFKGLIQNGLNNILIKASAFGDNPKSPIHMYEVFGFKPLNTTKEEIDKHIIKTEKGSRLDPNYRIMMYLPQDAILYSLLDKIDSLSEINQKNPNWLKL